MTAEATALLPVLFQPPARALPGPSQHQSWQLGLHAYQLVQHTSQALLQHRPFIWLHARSVQQKSCEERAAEQGQGWPLRHTTASQDDPGSIEGEWKVGPRTARSSFRLVCPEECAQVVGPSPYSEVAEWGWDAQESQLVAAWKAVPERAPLKLRLPGLRRHC